MLKCVVSLNFVIISTKKIACYTLFNKLVIKTSMKEGIKVLVENLISRFKLVKNRNPLHANELLDYVQKCYIEEEITIVEYKKLYCELDRQKAEKPQSYMIKLTSFENMILPS